MVSEQRSGGEHVGGALHRLDPKLARRLHAQAALLRACAPRLGAFIDLLGRRRWVIDGAFSALQGAAEIAAEDTDSLPAAVLRARTIWAEELKRLAGASGMYPRECELLDDLASYASQADPDELSFDVIYAAVAERVRALYDDGWPKVRLIVRRYASGGGSDDDRYGVRAETTLDTDGVVLVVLKVDPSAFGPAAYAAIPALLVHECCCHVFVVAAGIVDNASTFAEGFIDWAAEVYARDWLCDLGELGPVASQHSEPLFVEIAQRSPLAPERGFGRRTAEGLAQRLQRHHAMSRPSAQFAVAAFAIRINMDPGPLVRKDAFVTRIGLEGDHPVDPELLSAIRGLIGVGRVL